MQRLLFCLWSFSALYSTYALAGPFEDTFEVFGSTESVAALYPDQPSTKFQANSRAGFDTAPDHILFLRPLEKLSVPTLDFPPPARSIRVNHNPGNGYVGRIRHVDGFVNDDFRDGAFDFSGKYRSADEAFRNLLVEVNFKDMAYRYFKESLVTPMVRGGVLYFKINSPFREKILAGVNALGIRIETLKLALSIQEVKSADGETLHSNLIQLDAVETLMALGLAEPKTVFEQSCDAVMSFNRQSLRRL